MDKDQRIVKQNQYLEAATNHAFAAYGSIREGNARQALHHIRFSGGLYRLCSDTASLWRFESTQGKVARESILAHVDRTRFNAVSPDAVSIKEASDILEKHVECDVEKVDDAIGLSSEAQHVGSDTPEQCSTSTMKVLYESFHQGTVLPCSCPERVEPYSILDTHRCYLRLEGTLDIEGDETHCFVNSAITSRHSDECQWAHIQLQFPRYSAKVHFHVDEIENGENDLTTPMNTLRDICSAIDDGYAYPDHRVPLRLEGKLPNHQIYEHIPSFSQDCPKNCAPVSLSDALNNPKSLSAKSKVHLAFALARAFWHYYDSEWMQAKWDMQTICLLPQHDYAERVPTFYQEAQTPFLAITAISAQHVTFERYQPPVGRAFHPYQHLLRLGVLLILLCSNDITDLAPLLQTAELDLKTINALTLKSISEIHKEGKPWPALDLATRYKSRYRSIVQQCIPLLQGLNGGQYSTPSDRRNTLRDHVVTPLYDLLRDMDGPQSLENDEETEIAGIQSNANIGLEIDKTIKAPSDVSRSWLDAIRNSLLRREISNRLQNKTEMNRPKVAVIDTGYDPSSSCIGDSVRNRFNPQYEKTHVLYHWKDLWAKKNEPEDIDGHGTSMLSTILHLAPFADICVARIAGTDNDFFRNPSEVAKNLNEAIDWAVNVQHADIISMSLGWETEPLYNSRRVVKNALTSALTDSDQKVLFFAAASNYGAGRPEMYPARYNEVFSIRATDTMGTHEKFNTALPKTGILNVYGTLGVRVPTAIASILKSERNEGANRADESQSESESDDEDEIGRTGTSVATAITAAIAAIIIGFINTDEKKHTWDKIRTQVGFQNLLLKLSTEPESRKFFITLEPLFSRGYRSKLESWLNDAQDAS